MRASTHASLVVLLTGLLACDGNRGPTTPPPVTIGSVVVTPTPLAPIVPGQTVKLSASVRDEEGEVLTGNPITWTTGSEGIATVSSGGVVTAIGAGSTDITASVGGKTGTVSLTVEDGGFITTSGGSLTAAAGAVTLHVPAQSLGGSTVIRVTPVASPPPHPRLVPGTAFDIGEQGTTLAGGGTLALAYGDIPPGAAAGALRVHRWDGTAWQPLPSTVSLPDLKVSGTVSALGRFALISLVPVAKVFVNRYTLQLKPTATTVLYAIPRGPDNELLDGRAIEWSSNNTAVATVSAAGLVTAVAPGGPVRITATSEGTEGVALVHVAEEIAFVSLTASTDNTCALTATGQAWCWGDDDDGEAGGGEVTGQARTPVAVYSHLRFAEVGAAQTATCARALPIGTSWCWGSNASLVFGDPGMAQSLVPVPTSGNLSFSRLATGGSHACGLLQSGEAWCWGNGLSGQLGKDGAFTNSASPTRVVGGHTFAGLTVGSRHSCGLTAAGAAWCWGDNWYGQLGDGSFSWKNRPVAVAGGHLFEELVAGEWHTCGRTSSGEAWCWGWNEWGQLGDGTTLNRTIPTKVPGNEVWRSIHPSGWSTCGLLESGLAKCWGDNRHGTLGDGSTADASMPTPVMGGHAFTSLTSGTGYHICGIRVDGIAMCWGRNGAGQLGVGDLANRSVPTAVVMPTVQALRAMQ